MKSPNQKPFCPQCMNLIPTFTIENKQQKEVSIDCHCGYHSKISLSSYLDQYKKDIRISSYLTNCKDHYLPLAFLCQTCKTSICSECRKTHRDHLINKKSVLNIQGIRDRIAIAHSHIDNYFTSLMNEHISMLSDTITSITKAYQNAVLKNNNILSFFEILINNYDIVHPNFDIYQNVKRNLQDFNIYTIEERYKSFEPGEIPKVLKYYNEYNIL